MLEQRCPTCSKPNDVGIYVSGQKVKCADCGLPFTVVRQDLRARPTEKPRRESPRKDQHQLDSIPPRLHIPGYELCELLGKGGMGTVYRAKQLSLERTVAIKVLNEDLAKHASFVRRFEKESGALASLCHPNITTIIDRGHVDDVYYFVMEYVGGPSLRQRLNRDFLDLRTVLQMITVLCRSVDHAHQRGVIHRDLKPENVLFTHEGILKVLDFGLANIIGLDGKRWDLTRTMVSMGTAHYMAPEQRKDAKTVGSPADVYSLGVIFYEMLTGELPIGRFDLPSRKRKELDPRIERLVMKMLDANPDQRPQRLDVVAAFVESCVLSSLRGGGRGSQPDSAEDPGFEDLDSLDSAPIGVPLDSWSRDAEESVSTWKPEGARGSLRYSLWRGAWYGFGSSFWLGLWRRFLGELARPCWSRWLGSPRLRWGLAFAGAFCVALLSIVVVWQGLGPADPAGSDWRLVRQGKGVDIQLSNRRVVQRLRPATHRQSGDNRFVKFDFRPGAAAAPLSVAMLRGVWEVEQSALVHDACREGLTLQPSPARAFFGLEQPISPQNDSLKVALFVQPERGALGSQRSLSPDRWFLEALGWVRGVLPLELEKTIGLGWMNEDNQGVEIRLPAVVRGDGVEIAGQAALLVHGPGRQSTRWTFAIEPGRLDLALTRVRPLSLSLSLGRLRLALGEEPLLDQPFESLDWLEAYPMVSCQNLRCQFSSISYSTSSRSAARAGT